METTEQVATSSQPAATTTTTSDGTTQELESIPVLSTDVLYRSPYQTADRSAEGAISKDGEAE